MKEAPEVRQALLKAEEYASLAEQAETPEDRNYYERMRRKWTGIADGWRVIVQIDSTTP